MDTGISANKYIYNLLINDTKLKELVGDKIYPLVAEESVTYPFVIFTKEEVNGVYSKDLLMYDSITISVAVAATSYFQTVEVAERVRAILENRRDAYFYNILLESVTEEFIDDAFVQNLQFSAKIQSNK